MIILSNSLVLSAAEEAFPDSTPWIGWHDLVETTDITSTTEEDAFPITNVANPGDASEMDRHRDGDRCKYIAITTNYGDDIDYVGIAGHNFGAGAVTVSVEGVTTTSSTMKALLHFDGNGYHNHC